MRILIIGAGGVGFLLCEHLMSAHEVIVVDKNEEAINNVNSRLDVMAIYGDGKNPKLYEDLDKSIDLFIAATDSDDTNLLTSIMIDEVLYVDKKIVRLENNFYDSDKIREKLKIHFIIFPIKDTLSRIKTMIENPHAQSTKNIENIDFKLNSFSLKNVEEPITQTEFFGHIDHDIALCGIERNEKFFIPDKDEKLHKNDLLYLLCKLEDLQILGQVYGQKYPKFEGCVLFGANQLGREVAKLLLNNNISVRIFEQNMDLCKIAQKELGQDVSIYHTKYGIEHNFQSDEMKNAQMLIATTHKDEYNLVKCLEAKHNSIPKVMAVNNDLEYTSLMRNLGIEIIRGTKSSSFYGILENLGDTTLVLTKRYCGRDGCMLIRHTHGLIESTNIKDFSQKISSLGVFYIIREDKVLKMDENSQIKIHDTLIACCESKNYITLKKWLQKQF